MKTFISILVLLGTSAAMACPNLAGNYKCQSPDGSEIQVTMANRAGATVYSILDLSDNTTTEFIADGKEYPFEELGKYRASCKGANLEYHAYGQFEEEGTVVGSIDIKMNIFLEGRNIRSVGQQTFAYGGQTQTEQINEVCTRK